MKRDQNEICQIVIHGIAITTGIVALLYADMPGLESIALESGEVIMIILLGALFQINLKEIFGKSLIASAMAVLILNNASNIGEEWVPFLVNLSKALIAGGLIELIGFAAMKDFKNSANRYHRH